MQRLLIIEDDPGVLSLLRRSFAYEGYAVQATPDPLEGLRQLEASPPDLVILDLMLPGLSGLEVLRRLRAQRPELPVVLLTARDAPSDQVLGLEAGANDYVTKPFALEVLAARVRAHLRSRTSARPEPLRFADLVLNPAAHTAMRGERAITLTAQEFRLLSTFMETPQHVLSKSVLLDRAWGLSYLGDPNVVETFVKQLRQKLEAAGESRLIHTVRGVGYVLREG
ncbi:DNA-binding response OmpR family regulator [Deinobacterium chartae]|uniref:DNA-binding response OmpR family regulator n=1 Tax=Deinobacterium chartae TaxID=521158 RepID=A0A841I432_9DEIO|nr:response regulator transcription factor [Deinobacterium chartae]MBB6098665.1 DNA-binding response OmpR family regulator [Deinobacterium chartae]